MTTTINTAGTQTQAIPGPEGQDIGRCDIEPVVVKSPIFFFLLFLLLCVCRLPHRQYNHQLWE